MKWDVEELKTKLYSAVLSDIMDDLGFRNQTMQAEVRPLLPDMVIVGRCFPVLTADVFEADDAPYSGLIQALDQLGSGEVFMASVPSGRSAFWGELVSTASLAKGARGAIIDGYVRDTRKIMELGFPVFSKGAVPRDCKGRNIVVATGVPIECSGVRVSPGDLVFADLDGVAVVPKEMEQEVIRKALEKVTGEHTVREEFRKGRSVSEVFADYGIL